MFGQGKQVITDGVGQAPETEEDLNPLLAREYVHDTKSLIGSGSQLVKDIVRSAQEDDYKSPLSARQHTCLVQCAYINPSLWNVL